jgi:manganese/iron transport system permease protein
MNASWFTDPLAYEFMQRGMLTAIVVGVLCSVVGCYVVLRSMAFLGDAIAHAILPGVALAYLVGVNLLVGALAAAIVVALGVGVLSRQGRLKEDTAIGILFAAALSLGVALVSSMRNYAVDLTHILFGNVLGVSPAELFFTVAAALAALAVVGLLYRPFLLITFDPVLATTLRWPVDRLRMVLLVLLSLTVVVSLQTVGVGLVAAMLVTPAATALLVSRQMGRMMAVSAGVGALSAVIGLYASYYLDVASGAAVVLASTAIFGLTYVTVAARGRLSPAS